MQKLALSLSLLVGSALVSVAADKVDFQKQIAPILQKSCVECHSNEKVKGGLKLDTKEAALKGGKGGDTIVVGKADDSELFKRIILPKDHDDIMPPKGGPLPKDQIDLIKKWIMEGAVWPDGYVIKADAGAAEAHASAKPEKLPDFKPGPAEAKAVAQLEAAGVSIRPIAQNTQLKEANFRSLGTNTTDATIAPLKDVLGLMDLNLASTKITDNGLVALKTLTNLTILHLEHTGVSDAGLVHLKELKNLTYLNLFNTKVTDAGLKHLEGLEKLRNVYVWQTKVTDDGIKALQAKLPNVKVHKGVELTSAAPKEEKK
ncbi:MAG: c-type cytochrome domain-containing protein [Limisphaerales bacterium]